MKKFCLLLPLIFIANVMMAQKHTLSGIIKDSENGETLQGAYASLSDTATQKEVRGSLTNSAGFFSITVPDGTYKLRVFFLGYQELV